MLILRKLLAWIGRHLVALVLIVLILIAGRYALPPLGAWARGQIETSRAVPAQQAAYAEALRALSQYSQRRRAEIARSASELPRRSQAQLRGRRAEIDAAIARQLAARLSVRQLALAAAAGNSERIASHYKAGVEVALLERERTYIDSLLASLSADGRRSDLAGRRREAVAQLHASYRRWDAARNRAEPLNRRILAGPRNFLCRNASIGVGCRNYRALMAARAERDAALAENRRAEAQIRDIDRTIRALRTARAAAADASVIFQHQQEEVAAQIARLDRAAGDNWLLWIKKPVLETLPLALLILAIAIVSPALFKALLYFVIAPLAARRPAMRLVPGDGGVAAEAAAPAVSQRVAIDAERELLVVPDAVQSTPHEAEKVTKWLLRWTMPLSSLASGMVALIRVRARRPDFVLVSATDDPLAEIGLIAIEDGSAMVQRPRSLRGIVQPVGRPVRITRHWRVSHLSAWLTFQFRYLVFHGPCTLIVQGSRGVRLERAGPGRGINQAATIGFSAGLFYSVRRSEAFGAYLIGKQDLLNDSFDGAGSYLYEEMPRAGQKGGIWGRGLQGLGDAALKIFGI